MGKRKDKLIDTSEAYQSQVKRSLYSILVKPALEKALGVERINKFYEKIKGNAQDPARFAELALEEIGAEYVIPEPEIERLRKIEGPLALLCNYPYGGVAALFLVVLMSKIREDYRILANPQFGKVEELRERFILLDPFDETGEGRGNLSAIKELMSFMDAGGLLGVFPSDQVAPLNLKTGRLRQPDWNPNLARLILKTNAAVVPIYLHGHNNVLYNIAGALNPRLRAQFVIRELINPKSRQLQFKIGKAIDAETVQSYADKPDELTNFLKSRTYLLASSYKLARPSVNFKPIKEMFKKGRADVIPPQPAEALIDELSQLHKANRLYYQNGMEVFAFKANEAPTTLLEIGRLRELTFRAVGEGTGKPADLDEYDQYYDHLAVWNHEKSEIVGAYRVGKCDEIIALRGLEGLYLNTLFDLKPELFKQLHPALELGRSIVQPAYQRNYASLLLLWTGIGHYLWRHPRYRYLIGPVSISNSFHNASKHFIVRHLRRHFYNDAYAAYVQPRNPFRSDPRYDDEVFGALPTDNFKDLQEVIAHIEKEDMRVPVLIKHYLRMGSQALAFNVDPDFQDAIDALMVTCVPDIPAEQLSRYMTPEGYAEYIALNAPEG